MKNREGQGGAAPVPGEVSGGQSIHRAFRVLRALTMASQPVTKVHEMAETLGLNVATVHRILQVLVAEGFACRIEGSRAYGVGSDFFRLADAAKEKDRRYRLRPLLEATAKRFQDSVFLWIMEGSEVVCIDYCIGSYPVRVIPFEIGTRRPIGVGGAGIVALATLTREEALPMLARYRGVLEQYGVTIEQVMRLYRDCRKAGFVYQPGLYIPDIASIGLPIEAADGKLLAIVNLIAMRDRLSDPARQREVVDFVRKWMTKMPLA